MEQVYTHGSLENIFSWGYQSIQEPLEEMKDIDSIT
jgi:hypothetical protein